jgi:hypothetical protein
MLAAAKTRNTSRMGRARYTGLPEKARNAQAAATRKAVLQAISSPGAKGKRGIRGLRVW